MLADFHFPASACAIEDIAFPAGDDDIDKRWFVLYIDVRTLNPGASKRGREERARIYCGAVAGYVTAKGDHARHLKGDFLARTAGGRLLAASQTYLPEPLARELATKLRHSRGRRRVAFAVRIFAEPDDRPRSHRGFRYGCESCLPQPRPGDAPPPSRGP